MNGHNIYQVEHFENVFSPSILYVIALMAVWSKVLSLTASFLSPLPGF